MPRQYRFFIEDAPLIAGNNLTLNSGFGAEIKDQLVKVLRTKPGDEIVLMDNKEPVEKKYEVMNANKAGVELKFIENKSNENELDFQLELFLCLPNKPEKLSLMLQKAVELGVKKIVLFTSDFSQYKHDMKIDRLNRIIKEAAEQSERAFIPGLEIAGELKKYIEKNNCENLLVAMERGDAPSIGKDFTGTAQILVGPEGGFSESEKALIKSKNIHCFSLGKRILRMETAVILALGLCGIKS